MPATRRNLCRDRPGNPRFPVRGLWEIVYDQNLSALGMAELGGQETQELMRMVQEEYEKVLSLIADVRGGEALDEETLSQALFGVSGRYWASLAAIDTA